MKKILFYMLLLAMFFSFGFSLSKSIKVDASTGDDIVYIDEQEDDNTNEGNVDMLDLPTLGGGENHDGNGNSLLGGDDEGDTSVCSDSLPTLGGGENHDGNGNGGILGGDDEGDASVCSNPLPSLGGGENHDGNGNGGILGDIPDTEESDK